MIKINCDLCGKVDEELYKTLIEGIELNVCTKCVKFGKVLKAVKTRQMRKDPKPAQIGLKKETIKLIVENYSDIIKRKRESMGLDQKDFAKKINEKESTVHNFETGHFEPSLEIAEKLEKILGIKLIEGHEEEYAAPANKRRDDRFTLGDFVKIKK
ncbi:MAG: multiprotein bridging factor aMBF1 [Nanoarchaeota archaeon]